MTTPPARRYGAGHILLIVFGALFLLVGLGLLGGGSVLTWADRTQRDAGGYLNSGLERVDSSAYAVTARDINLDVPGWMTGTAGLGTVRVSVTPATAGAQLFVGIAPRSSVDTYLAAVERDQVRGWHTTSGAMDLDHFTGSAPTGSPGAQAFWVASASGPGTQTLTWEVRSGVWSVVAMNADASRGLAFDVRAGATAPFLLALGIGLLCGGFLVLLLGVLMVVLGARGGREPGVAPQGWAPAPPGAGWAPPPPPARSGSVAAPLRMTVYPVALYGHLDEPLSRWLWLVKWLLVIPHYFILALLSVPVVLLTIFAWFAILFTGRYPRTVFDFNLGVLRWWWRASFYAYSALGTDRYPPFSLGDEPDYPARLDIAYPERLSRGLVLVKSWLLAIPHIIIVGLLIGGLGFRGWPWGVGLVGILVTVAAVILLFAGRYNREIFDLVMGFNRWVFRTMAYIMLMRDEYPPFRLDTGENEPDMAGTAPTGADDHAPPGGNVAGPR